jgi:hypothetical protein
MNEFASAVRIFHSRVAKENGSNGTKGYTVREKLSPSLPGLVWALGPRGSPVSGRGGLAWDKQGARGCRLAAKPL